MKWKQSPNISKSSCPLSFSLTIPPFHLASSSFYSTLTWTECAPSLTRRPPFLICLTPKHQLRTSRSLPTSLPPPPACAQDRRRNQDCGSQVSMDEPRQSFWFGQKCRAARGPLPPCFPRQQRPEEKAPTRSQEHLVGTGTGTPGL